ncbi:MAG: hypothetical protein FWB85_10250 [Chitinispirillia bacterium]|nr:hypothetical protein [Chitinispirillia bacterium]
MPAAARLKNNNVKNVNLTVQGDKYPFFIELIRNFDFVKIEPSQTTRAPDGKENLIANIKKGFIDKKSIDDGTIKTFPIGDLFDE